MKTETLFIGGTRDGQRRLVDGSETLVTNIITPKSEGVDEVSETYVAHTFMGKQNIRVFVEASIGHEGLNARLIEGYQKK